MTENNTDRTVIKIPEAEVVPVAPQKVFPLFEERGLRVLTENLRIAKNLLGNWTTPAGILLTILFTFLTADFHETFSLSADTWVGITLALTLFVCAWLILAIMKSYNASKVSAKTIMQELKSDTSEEQNT